MLRYTSGIVLRTNYACEHTAALGTTNFLRKMTPFACLLWWEESAREFLDWLGLPVTDAFFMEFGHLFWWWCHIWMTVNIGVRDMKPLRWALWQAMVLLLCVVSLDCSDKQRNQALHLWLWGWIKHLKGWSLEGAGYGIMKLPWFIYKKTLWRQKY